MADRALPGLVTRLTLDSLPYKEGVAAVEKATAGMAGTVGVADKAVTSLETAQVRAAATAIRLGIAQEATAKAQLGLETARVKAAAAAELHGAAAKKEAIDLDLVSAAAAKTAGALTLAGKAGSGLSSVGAGGGLFGSAGGLLGVTALLALPAAGAGVLAWFEEASKKAEDYSVAILRASNATGVQTGMLQTLTRAADQLGLPEETLNMLLERFNKNLAAGGTTLKPYGLDLAALGIHATDTATAFSQLADYIQKHNNAMENAAIVTALFGRGGAVLLPLLQQGSDFLKGYNAELERYGLILTDDQLKQGALAATVRDEFGMAIKGVELQLGVQLEGAFTALFLTLEKAVGGSKQLFIDLGNVVGTVVTAIASFLQGLLGIKITMTDVQDASTSYTAKLSGLSQRVQDLSNQQDALTTSIKDNTQAQQDAIATIQDQQKAQDELYDSKTRLLDATTRELDLETQAIDLHRTAANDQRKIAKDNRDLIAASFEGSVSKMSAAGAQLTTDVQGQADDQEKANIDAAKNILAAKKQQIANEKRDYDQAEQHKVDLINDEIKAEQRKLTTVTADYQAALKAQQTANAAGTNDFVTNLEKQIAKGNSDWQGYGEGVKKWLADPFSKQNQDALASAADRVGVAIGKAIMQGIWEGVQGAPVDVAGAIAGRVTGKNYDAGASLKAGWDKVVNFLEGLNPVLNAGGGLSGRGDGHAEGGVFGLEHLARIAEGGKTEAVIPLTNPARRDAVLQQAGLPTPGGSGGGSPTYNFTIMVQDFTGDSDRLAKRIRSEVGDIVSQMIR